MVKHALWEEALALPNTSIEQAMRLLERCPLQIVLVVNDERELLGSVTDGDIRRAILNHVSLDTEIHKIMHENPLSVQVGASESEMKTLLDSNSVSHVPILKNKTIVGLRTIKDYFHENSLQEACPVLIMAGGFGTRLQPLTNELPKPMVELEGKPILEHIICSLKAQGLTQLFISTHYYAEKIKAYFDNGSKWGVSIQYVHEVTPLGTAGALNLLNLPGDVDKLIVMNGDVISNVNMHQLLLFYHSDIDNRLTIGVRNHDVQIPFGVIKHENHVVMNIEEKPLRREYVSAGIYVIDRDVLKLMTQYDKIDMPELINLALKNGYKTTMFPIVNYWKDLGTLDDYQQASEDVRTIS
jgi:UDP-2,4-diacetamido-2,4,6-trideoxy-beta-L-gulopyranose hydrolase